MGLFNKVLSVSAILFGTAFIYKVSRKSNSENFKNATKYSNSSNNLNEKSNEPEVSNNEKTKLHKSESRTQKMFKELGMTEDQKKRYNESINSVISDWNRNNLNKEMDNKFLDEKLNKSMKSLLNEVQYGMYRSWTEKNMN